MMVTSMVSSRLIDLMICFWLSPQILINSESLSSGHQSAVTFIKASSAGCPPKKSWRLSFNQLWHKKTLCLIFKISFTFD